MNISARFSVAGVRAVKNGEWGTWVPMWLCGPEVAESTVGIIGLGRIGFSIAKRVRGFGIKRLLYQDVVEMPHAKEVNGEYSTMEKLLTESDFIIASCNLTEETKHLFRNETFKKMKNTAVLVNISRGGVVNLADLYEALKSGEIRAAAVDVTDPEPLPKDNPLLTVSIIVQLQINLPRFFWKKICYTKIENFPNNFRKKNSCSYPESHFCGQNCNLSNERLFNTIKYNLPKLANYLLNKKAFVVKT